MTIGEHNNALKTKKKIYKTWWFWAIIIVIALVLFIPKDSATKPSSSNSEAPAPATTGASNPSNTIAQPAAEPSVPAEYKSALSKASTYSSSMHMSKQGVYDQLTSEYGEKFKPEAAQYAIDNVKADWNANALAKAKTYQGTMSMSPAAVRDQLVSQYGEKFTPAEADYAIQHIND